MKNVVFFYGKRLFSMQKQGYSMLKACFNMLNIHFTYFHHAFSMVTVRT